MLLHACGCSRMQMIGRDHAELRRLRRFAPRQVRFGASQNSAYVAIGWTFRPVTGVRYDLVWRLPPVRTRRRA